MVWLNKNLENTLSCLMIVTLLCNLVNLIQCDNVPQTSSTFPWLLHYRSESLLNGNLEPLLIELDACGLSTAVVICRGMRRSRTWLHSISLYACLLCLYPCERACFFQCHDVKDSAVRDAMTHDRRSECCPSITANSRGRFLKTPKLHPTFSCTSFDDHLITDGDDPAWR